MPGRVEDQREPILVDTHDVIAYVRRIFDQDIAAGTVASWASRGKLTRHGYHPETRRALYDLHEVHALAEQIYGRG